MPHRKSVMVSYIILFSSLAIILALTKAELPFPLLPYLKFDFAEVPVMLLLLVSGLGPALIAETIHWIGLTIRSGDVLGPLMKYLAVIPMLLGFWFGIEVYRKFAARRESKGSLIMAFRAGMIAGTILRVAVCSITNIFVLLLVAPQYLTFASLMLKNVGINTSSPIEALTWTLLLTAIFNVLHVPFSSAIATIIFKAAALRIPVIAKESWISLKVNQRSSIIKKIGNKQLKFS